MPGAFEGNLLVMNNFFRAVPHTVLVCRLRAEEGNVDGVKRQRFTGFGPQQDGLPMEEMAPGEKNGDALHARESLCRGEAVRDDPERRHWLVAKGLCQSGDGGSGIKINGGAGLNQLTGASGDTVFSVPKLRLTFAERSETLIKIADRAAEGANDPFFTGERSQVAPGRGFGNLEQAADFLNREVRSLLEESGQFLASRLDEVKGNFQVKLTSKYLL